MKIGTDKLIKALLRGQNIGDPSSYFQEVKIPTPSPTPLNKEAD